MADEDIRDMLRAATSRATQLATEAEALLVEAVQKARDAGWSYRRIAAELGVTRQAAWERFSKKVKQQ